MASDRTTLFERLKKADLLDEGQIQDLAGLPESSSTDPRALGTLLLKRKWLTRYQINQVALGRGAELRVGPYLLLEKVGEGGMGQVFRARHRHMQRIVALKLIRKDKLSSEEAVKRFYQEAQAAGQLHHPNIVIAYDAGPAGNSHYFAMEYIAGIDLSKLISESGPLPVGLACEYVRQAAIGLQHAHERGLVHRDIKPANLLATEDSSGHTVIKILDMGLARAQSSGGSQNDLTKTGQVMGTPDYLAPEQALDARTVDARSDLYSLGCTLYYLLTGRPPFTGDSLAQVLLKHQMTDPELPPDHGANIPGGVWSIVRKLLAKQPEKRFQSAADVVSALQPWCDTTSSAVGITKSPASARSPASESVWGTILGDENGDAPRRPRKKTGDSTERIPASQLPKLEKRRTNRDLLLIGGGVGAAILLLLTLIIVVVVLRHKDEKTDNTVATSTAGAISNGDDRTGAAIVPAPVPVPPVPAREEAADENPAPPPVAPAEGRELAKEDVPVQVKPLVGQQSTVVKPNNPARPPRRPQMPEADFRDAPPIRDDVPTSRKSLIVYKPGPDNGCVHVAITADGHYGWFMRSSFEWAYAELPAVKLRPLRADRNFHMNTQAFAPNNKQALTASSDGLLLWDLHTGALVRPFKQFDQGVKQIVFSRDGKFVVTSRGSLKVIDKKATWVDCGIRLWDFASGRQLRSWDWTDRAPDQIGISAKGDRVYGVSNQEWTMHTYDTQTGDELPAIKLERRGGPAFAHMSPDGRHFLSSGSVGSAYLWDTELKQGTLRLLEPGSVKGVGWSPSGLALTSSLVESDDKPGTTHMEIRGWNGETGELLRRMIGDGKSAWSMAASEDGRRVLVGDCEGAARMYTFP
jgi:serine/threonine-protein kinase